MYTKVSKNSDYLANFLPFWLKYFSDICNMWCVMYDVKCNVTFIAVKLVRNWPMKLFLPLLPFLRDPLVPMTGCDLTMISSRNWTSEGEGCIRAVSPLYHHCIALYHHCISVVSPLYQCCIITGKD